MSKTKSIILSGVGGQGTILVSKLLTAGLAQAGYDVKMSEVHGMAQRGGSVSTQIRWGSKVFSPIIGKGEADILVAFEKMEALRYSQFLKPEGIAVINDFSIIPMTVASGVAVYPDGTIEEMQKNFKTIVIEAATIAKSLGNERCMNVVLLGTLVKALDLTDIPWEEILKANLKPQIVEMNLKAFEAGYKG